MLIQSKLPKNLWGYALLHANYIKNRTYLKALPNKTPYEMVHNSKPRLNDSYKWGTEVYVKIQQADKLKA
jgi:hypothetical protein